MGDIEISLESKVLFLQCPKNCSDMSDIEISLGTKVLFQQHPKNCSDIGDIEIPYKQTFPYSSS